MSALIIKKTYKSLPLCEKEVLRYAGCKEPNEETLALLRSCFDQAKFSDQVCYCELPVSIAGEECNFEVFALRSKALARNLDGCSKTILFAATIGVEMDRLIAKYSRLSPAKALMLQAIGAAQIEALCDAFCADLAAEKKVGFRPRFSPGYGDLPLETQREIFAVLGCEKQIGLTLSEHLLMLPSKSVTAFAGITQAEQQRINKCGSCTMKNCAYRGTI